MSATSNTSTTPAVTSTPTMTAPRPIPISPLVRGSRRGYSRLIPDREPFQTFRRLLNDFRPCDVLRHGLGHEVAQPLDFGGCPFSDEFDVSVRQIPNKS